MTSREPQAWNNFLHLLGMRLGEDIGYDDFRIAIEDIYNFRLDHKSVSTRELDIIERLFDRVSRYSPFPKDRKRYPGAYIDEKQFEEAVREARRDLGI